MLPRIHRCARIGTGDHNYIKANTKFFAVPYRGVGSLAVIPYGQTGKQKPSFPMIQGHKGKVLDFDFNPFHEPVVTGVPRCPV